MAITMPVSRKPVSSGGMSLPHDEPKEVERGPKPLQEWGERHQRDLLDDIRHGRESGIRLDEEQHKEVGAILTEASGADRTMSPVQVRDALHKLEKGRIELRIDKGTFEALKKRISDGPGAR